MQTATLYTLNSHYWDVTKTLVEVSVRRGLPRFQVIGLAGTQIKESTERIRFAIEESGFHFPFSSVLVNLAPTSDKKNGSGFDLAIALGILKATGQLSWNLDWEKTLVFGELGLEGSVRAVSGLFHTLTADIPSHFDTLLIPHAHLGLEKWTNIPKFHTLSHLSELKGNFPPPKSQRNEKETEREILFTTPFPTAREEGFGIWISSPPDEEEESFEIAPEQMLAFQGLQMAVLGGHHCLFLGEPGVGKTTIAQFSKKILLPPEHKELLEIIRLQVLTGQKEENILFQRPFRAPHHSSSEVSLVGGAHPFSLGEISLAHKGILFLDELPEFSQNTLQSLRESMESKKIQSGRWNNRKELPADYTLVATANPCPCGYWGSFTKECICSSSRLRSYHLKMSPPLLERFSIVVRIRNPNQSLPKTKVFLRDLRNKLVSTKKFRDNRLSCENKNDENWEEWNGWINGNFLNPRKKAQLKDLSRTIADWEESPEIKSKHLSQAVLLSEEAETFSVDSRYTLLLRNEVS